MEHKNLNIPVALGVVAEKKKYEKPDMQVIDLNETPRLLQGSTTYGAGFRGVGRDDEEW